MEPVEDDMPTTNDNTMWAMSEARKATLANAKAAYSIAIRGVRHTYHRMACSVNR